MKRTLVLLILMILIAVASFIFDRQINNEQPETKTWPKKTTRANL